MTIRAMAHRRPVAGTRYGATPEIVVHGETGFLFDPGDESALAGHLRTLLGDAALRARMSAAARVHMVTHFDLGLTRPEWALGYRFDIVLRGRLATPLENAA